MLVITPIVTHTRGAQPLQPLRPTTRITAPLSSLTHSLPLSLPPAQHTSVCREIDSRDFTMADLKKDVPVEAASHRIRITLTSRNVANLEKGACGGFAPAEKGHQP